MYNARKSSEIHKPFRFASPPNHCFMGSRSKPNPDNTRELHDQACQWLIRQEAHDFSEVERVRMLCWLDADVRHRQAYEEMASLWGQLDRVAEIHSGVRGRSTQSKHDRWAALQKRVGLGLAASVLLISSLLAYPLVAIQLQSDFYNDTGKVSTFRLSDGTQVHLNSDSALDLRFSENTRELELLQGEAFFQVQPDKTRPFRVVAGSTSATALGTAYLVRRDREQGLVTVTEGRVEVEQQSQRNQSTQTPVEVRAGESLHFENSKPLDAVQPADLKRATAWMRGKLLFDGEPLDQVVAELNRYHHGLILIVGDQLAQRRVSGVFDTKDPLHVLDSIARSLHLQISRLGSYLIVLRES